jgi:hypothetical protein
MREVVRGPGTSGAELLPVQLGVQAASGEELIVGALGDESALVEDEEEPA